MIYPRYQSTQPADICIIGSGPVGIATALHCAKAGLHVHVLEAGNFEAAPSAFAPPNDNLSDGRHAAMDVSVCKALGGTSKWWGGRCVPMDDIDFEKREYVPEANWPISHAEIARWYPQAATFFSCGPAVFNTQADILADARFDALERWAPNIDMGSVHQQKLKTSKNVIFFLNSEVTELLFSSDGTKIDGAKIAGSGEIAHASNYILACGGIGTARLLLLAQRHMPNHFGGSEGALGRYYMGHISGKIANLRLANADEARLHDFFKEDGAFARRRFTFPMDVQKREGILNTAFWADNPPFHDVDHHNGVLSMVWLALAIPPIGRKLVSEGIRVSHLGPKPWHYAKHLANVLGHPISIATDMSNILLERIIKRPKKPGFLLRNSKGCYALHYHAEQVPQRCSRVTLSDTRDQNGNPQLDVDFRYCQQDIDSVIRAHTVLDRSLRSSGRGHLEYRVSPDTLAESVWNQATDGFHQAGLTRMGTDPSTSVVDPTCRVHGLQNTYLATSGVFPSTGQANSTFAAVALGYRLADHLCNTLKSVPDLH